MTKIIYVTNTILIILKTTTSTSHDDISFFTPCMAANTKRKSFWENNLAQLFVDEACSVTDHT